MLEQEKGVFSSGGLEESALRLGMRWFIVSLTVFLVASVVAIVVIRTQVDAWPELPPAPIALWWSTGFIVMSTVAMQKVKRVWNPTWMWATIVLILLFLLFQILAAVQWHETLTTVAESDEVVAIARMAMYVLIFLHGMHVVGGLVPLMLVSTRTGYRKHTSLVPLLVTYWDFICCIWILFFVVILLLR
jgi:cytochrome c oxidase subunit 3